jgi:hypothetical protein
MVIVYFLFKSVAVWNSARSHVMRNSLTEFTESLAGFDLANGITLVECSYINTFCSSSSSSLVNNRDTTEPTCSMQFAVIQVAFQQIHFHLPSSILSIPPSIIYPIHCPYFILLAELSLVEGLLVEGLSVEAFGTGLVVLVWWRIYISTLLIKSKNNQP